jgi:hypothetical protein
LPWRADIAAERRAESKSRSPMRYLTRLLTLLLAAQFSVLGPQLFNLAVLLRACCARRRRLIPMRRGLA